MAQDITKKPQNKLVYYHEGQEYEIPLHLRQAKLRTPYDDTTEIEIIAVCKNRRELGSWNGLIDYLAPYSRRK